MKNIINLLTISFLVSSCTKEVFIPELLNFEERIVIEANIDIAKGDVESSKKQTITISKTTSFYNQDYKPVTNAVISVTDKDGNSMGTFFDDHPDDAEDKVDGIYTSLDFTTPNNPTNPNAPDEYFVSVTINGETYKAKDTYHPVVDFGRITSRKEDNLLEDGAELTILLENEIGVDNYFLIQSKEIKKESNSENELPDLEVFDDEFYSEEPGENIINIPAFVEQISTIKQLDFTLYGISQKHYNFLNKIFTQAESDGGPFSTAPAQIRGNFVNETNKENFAYGYFSMNQFVKTSFKFQE